VEAFIPVAGPDGWRELGELAAATGIDDIWRRAESHAAGIVAEAATRPGVDSERVARAVRRQLDGLRP
jgi:hypothetical protein